MDIKNRWKTVAIQEDLKELLKKFDTLNFTYEMVCDGDLHIELRKLYEKNIEDLLEDIEAEISNIDLYIKYEVKT